MHGQPCDRRIKSIASAQGTSRVHQNEEPQGGENDAAGEVEPAPEVIRQVIQQTPVSSWMACPAIWPRVIHVARHFPVSKRKFQWREETSPAFASAVSVSAGYSKVT